MYDTQASKSRQAQQLDQDSHRQRRGVCERTSLLLQPTTNYYLSLQLLLPQHDVTLGLDGPARQQVPVSIPYSVLCSTSSQLTRSQPQILRRFWQLVSVCRSDLPTAQPSLSSHYPILKPLSRSQPNPTESTPCGYDYGACTEVLTSENDRTEPLAADQHQKRRLTT